MENAVKIFQWVEVAKKTCAIPLKLFWVKLTILSKIQNKQEAENLDTFKFYHWSIKITNKTIENLFSQNYTMHIG